MSRRIFPIGVTLGLAASGLVATAGPANAAAAKPAVPIGMHVVKATRHSLTVGLRPSAHATKYKVLFSTVKTDLYWQNYHHPSSHRHIAVSHRPKITVKGLKYTAKPVYYRVIAMNHSHDTLAGNYSTGYLKPPAPKSIHARTEQPGAFVSWGGRSAAGYEVQQSTSPSFASDVRDYHVVANKGVSPYGLNAGQTYYYRVRADNHGQLSKPSATTKVRASRQSPLSVDTYNVLDATYDNTASENGAKRAPFADRRASLLQMIESSNANAIGVQEANACVKKRKGKRCLREVDSLNKGLRDYKLSDNSRSPSGRNYFQGNYILYKPSVLTPIAHGGHWMLDSGRSASYQAFRMNSTGAKFLMVDTHLVVGATEKFDDQRAAEARTMMKDIRAYQRRVEVGPLVVVGDFNSSPGMRQYADKPGKVMRDDGMLDGKQIAQTHFNTQYSTVNNYERRAPKTGYYADHVFASPGVAVASWGEMLNVKGGKFVGTIPSDHNLVLSQLEIPY